MNATVAAVTISRGASKAKCMKREHYVITLGGMPLFFDVHESDQAKHDSTAEDNHALPPVNKVKETEPTIDAHNWPRIVWKSGMMWRFLSSWISVSAAV